MENEEFGERLMHLCGAVLVLCVVAFGHFAHHCAWWGQPLWAALLGSIHAFHAARIRSQHAKDSARFATSFIPGHGVLSKPLLGNSGLMFLPEKIYSAMLLADLE
jgi:hypothetical protein